MLDSPLSVLLRPASTAAKFFVAICLFTLMMLTTLDVIGRYFFDKPLPGAFELTELLMVLVIFGALPIVTARRRHIVVDILDFAVPERMRRVRHFVTNALSAVALAATLPHLWAKVVAMLGYGEVTAILGIPVVPLAMFVLLLTAVTSAVFLANAFLAPDS